MSKKLSCGMSIDRLSVYSDYCRYNEGLPEATAQRMRSHCDSCMNCRQYLANLARVDQAAQELMAPQLQADFQESWYQQLLDWLRLELRPGKDLPLPTLYSENISLLTNGAIRSFIRHWGTTDRTIVAKTQIEVEERERRKPILHVWVEILVGYPVEITSATELVRSRIKHGIENQFEAESGRIDIEVTDLVIRKVG